MVEIPYPLTTERLVLRRFTADDLAPYYAYQRLPETTRYLLRLRRERLLVLRPEARGRAGSRDSCRFPGSQDRGRTQVTKMLCKCCYREERRGQTLGGEARASGTWGLRVWVSDGG